MPDNARHVHGQMMHVFRLIQDYFCFLNTTVIYPSKQIEYIPAQVQPTRDSNKNLIDLTAIDFLNKNLDFRFKLVYNFLSFFQNRRFLLSLFFSEISVNSLYSLSFIFKNANWLEREIWDLFGIFFCNHPDLRRILTDYGFEGFPLRKDFPTVGFVEVRYDDEKKSILYEPVSFSQEFRTFSFSSPWPQFH